MSKFLKLSRSFTPLFQIPFLKGSSLLFRSRKFKDKFYSSFVNYLGLLNEAEFYLSTITSNQILPSTEDLITTYANNVKQGRLDQIYLLHKQKKQISSQQEERKVSNAEDLIRLLFEYQSLYQELKDGVTSLDERYRNFRTTLNTETISENQKQKILTELEREIQEELDEQKKDIKLFKMLKWYREKIFQYEPLLIESWFDHMSGKSSKIYVEDYHIGLFDRMSLNGEFKAAMQGTEQFGDLVKQVPIIFKNVLECFASEDWEKMELDVTSNMHHALKNVHQRQTEGKWKVNFDQLKIDPKIQLIKVDSFDRVRYGPDFMQHHIVEAKVRLKFNVKYSLTNEHGEFRFPAFSQKETKEVKEVSFYKNIEQVNLITKEKMASSNWKISSLQ